VRSPAAQIRLALPLPAGMRTPADPQSFIQTAIRRAPGKSLCASAAYDVDHTVSLRCATFGELQTPPPYDIDTAQSRRPSLLTK
jgi:hypothetical protein